MFLNYIDVNYYKKTGYKIILFAKYIWLKMSLSGIAYNLSFVMLMKVITGLCFGIVIGLVRYKTKNCYAGMLTHSIMNVFGR